MQSGRLDRYVTIQRAVKTQETDGHPLEAWSSLGALRRPASMRPLRGDERFSDPQWVAQEQIEFRVRYSTSIASLTPNDRVIHPAITQQELNDSPQPDVEDRRIHDVIAVHEIGRREGLQIITVRRADVPA